MGAVSVLHEGGDRFRIEMRGHTVTVDQPIPDGGDDVGPTPTELFVASLASCVAFYGRRFLRRHRLPQHVSVDVRWELGTSPARVARMELDVEAPGLPAEMRERFVAVIEHCTVHNSIVDPPEMAIRLTPAPALAVS